MLVISRIWQNFNYYEWMKNILTVLFILTASVSFSQVEKNSKVELIGIWALTDFVDPDKFEDTWEFTADSTFNQLKYKSDGDRTLIPDENGSWTLKEKKLQIVVTGERTNGKQKRYAKSQVMEFEVSKNEDDVILTLMIKGTKATKFKLVKK